MLKKIVVIGIIIMFIGAGIVSSGIKNISNVNKDYYFRNKDIKYRWTERNNHFRNRNLKLDLIDKKSSGYDRGLSGWSITDVVSTESTAESYNACVTIDSNGSIHVVWDDDTDYGGSGSDKDIFYKMKPNGGSWTATEVVSMESDNDCFYSSLVIDSNGDIHVVWDDAYYTGGNVYYKMKPNGGSWTSEELISTESSDASSYSSMFVDSDDTIHIVWCSVTDEIYSIYYKYKLSGGSWTDAEMIPLEEYFIPSFPVLAVEPDGTLHLAWDDYIETNENVFYKKKPNGGSWSATEVVSSESLDYSYAPILEVDSNGDIHIIWIEITENDTSHVRYKTKPNGGSWTSMETISLYEIAWISDLAVEPDGTVHVVWDELDIYGDFWFEIYYRTKPYGGSWSDAELVSTESEEDSIYPDVAVEPDGTVHVVWVDTFDYCGAGDDIDIFYKNRVNENQPPDIPTITGSDKGVPGVEYIFCINASDPDNDTLFVLWNWGDGTSGEWLGPYVSGSEICDSHIWNETGTYTISVTVMDEYGECVTAEKDVRMPRDKSISNSFLLRFLEKYQLLQRLLTRLGLH